MEGVCGDVVGIVTELLIHLNVSTVCCLEQENTSKCVTPTTQAPPTTKSNRVSTSQGEDIAFVVLQKTDIQISLYLPVYGYGFLMVVLVSLASLVGLAIIPFSSSKKFKSYYHYVNALLVALGASALFCDAVLHLIPEVTYLL